MNAITLRGVTKTFSGHTAVNDLSLEVPKGSIYGFLGPNGSGKTTTIRMIMNIILPDQGEIEVLGEKSTRVARSKVSYLPEERGLYKKMEVRRLLTYFGRLQGLDGKPLQSAITSWLEKMGLTKWEDKRVEALSKGMSQKIQFIAAAISDPELLILDEPFSGLDPVNAQVLQESVLELRSRGTTIVFSTHDMRTAERLCDRLFMIFKGNKVLDGTLSEIQASYGADTVRLRSAMGMKALEDIEGIEALNDHGNLQEFRYQGDAQALLQKLSQKTSVYHFEIAAPSLHDIFVRIARPTKEEMASMPQGGANA